MPFPCAEFFAVDNSHVDFVCAFDCRKMFLQKAAARCTDNISDV